MIERRIGLLFASFLLLLVLGIGRAAWVQGVQGGGLTAPALTALPGAVPVVPWPTAGQAVLSVAGVGRFGSFGLPSRRSTLT